MRGDRIRLPSIMADEDTMDKALDLFKAVRCDVQTLVSFFIVSPRVRCRVACAALT